METFQPEGGERRRKGGEKSSMWRDVNSLTDDCSRTKAGDVSSAGGAGVGLVSLAFSGLSALHA